MPPALIPPVIVVLVVAIAALAGGLLFWMSAQRIIVVVPPSMTIRAGSTQNCMVMLFYKPWFTRTFKVTQGTVTAISPPSVVQVDPTTGGDVPCGGLCGPGNWRFNWHWQISS